MDQDNRKKQSLERIIFWGAILIGFAIADIVGREVSTAESRWTTFGAIAVFLVIARAAYRAKMGR